MQFHPDTIPKHDIHEDLKSIEADLQVAKSMAMRRSDFVFDPDLEEGMLDSIDLADYQISNEQLEKIVQRVKKVRLKLSPTEEEEEEISFRKRTSPPKRENELLDADFQATIEHAMNDEALNEESRIIASFNKGKKLTTEQKIFLVKQKMHLGRSTKAIVA